MEDNIRIISLNVKGLRVQKSKRGKIFKWLSDIQKANVVFLQETHSTKEDETAWKDEWGGDIYYSHGQSNSRGVCIMLNIEHNNHQIYIDPDGRYIILDTTIFGKRLTLMNLYAPNKDDPAFVSNIFQVMDLTENDDRILGGDFNCILQDIDKKGGAPTHANRNMRNTLLSHIDETDLVDIWRQQHPDDRNFTYHCKIGNEYVFTRLDFFLVSFGISNLIKSSSIKPSILTDHSLVDLNLCIQNNKRGPGFWKFNCALLYDDNYVQMIKNAIQETVQIEYVQTAGLLWEAIKLRIRTDTIRYCSRKKRFKNNTLMALNKRLQRLQTNFQLNPTSEESAEIDRVKEDIDTLLQEKLNGVIIRSKIDWHEHGEKPSKFFLNIEKRNFNNKTIRRIHTSNGTTTTDDKVILDELYVFYSNLYKTSHEIPPNFSDLDHLELPQLNDHEQALCEGPLTQTEILNALKTCKNNKSPGTDGLPAEFLKFFWVDIKDFLVNALNYSYDIKKLSNTQRAGLITLIPKKGKDTLSLKNWRPITLLNQDYKLATKAIAKRLCSVLPKLINPDQTGFLKERYIGENVVKILNIMDYLTESNEAALLLSADFEKAFDSLEWDFVEYTLKKFNFGDSLIRWVKIFYNEITTQVSNNGWVTNIFKPSRGSRQGCPLSPYIFILCAEILSALLKTDESIHGIHVGHKTFLVSQYADDTLVTIQYSENCLKQVIKVFEIYARYSGLRVNYDKSEIMPLGRIKYVYEILVPECNFHWTQGPIRSLGIDLCHRTEDLIKLNYSKALKKVENTVNVWGKRYLTLYGKVTIINSLIIPKLVYLLSVLPKPSTNIFVQINTLLYKFLWNNKKDKIKREIMKLPKDLGGMMVPDMTIKDYALKISWVTRINKQDNHWNIFLEKDLPISINTLWKLNFNSTDAGMLIKNIPNRFICDIIISWATYNFYIPQKVNDIRNQIIWFNSHIKVNSQPIYIERLYRRNILYVHQFFSKQGIPLTHNQFQIKYEVQINFLTYYGLIAAIPKIWKVNMKTNHMEPTTDTTNKALITVNKKDHISRQVYLDMIEQGQKETHATGYMKWAQYFSNNITQKFWQQSFQKMYGTLKCTKTLYVQFKILHFIIATREKLKLWGLSETEICSFCEEEIETLPHLFLECEVIKRWWRNVQEWYEDKTGVYFHLSPVHIIFGIDATDTLNTILMLGKRYIYNCANTKQFPCINNFITFVTKFAEQEREIYIRNNNLNVFTRKWSFL